MRDRRGLGARQWAKEKEQQRTRLQHASLGILKGRYLLGQRLAHRLGKYLSSAGGSATSPSYAKYVGNSQYWCAWFCAEG